MRKAGLAALLCCPPMRLSDFDYDLPGELIARYPPAARRDSRLLVVDACAGRIEDRNFADFPSLLGDDDLLVFNDTRVIKARLTGRKSTGGRVEVLIERLEGSLDALAHVRASKAPRPGTLLAFAEDTTALVTGREDDLFRLTFSRPLAAFLEEHGEVPLPPYLEREAEPEDEARYQTVYAREPGAVAAPTAGLHFDRAMLDELAARGNSQAFVTLHVGAGTFRNLREDQVEDNRLHGERVQVGEAVCAAVRTARERGGRVVAVGTTSVRALEAAAQHGEIRPFDGETDLFIRPGFAFHAVDALLTNFHLPRSSLLMLVAALAGRELVLEAYRHAVRERYRFFSYGDAMFIRCAA